MEPCLRFTLSQPARTDVIGCDDLKQLEENDRFASSFRPMSEGEQGELIRHVAPFARRLMYYKP